LNPTGNPNGTDAVMGDVLLKVMHLPLSEEENILLVPVSAITNPGLAMKESL
jgi:hypothetical protein